MNTPGLGRRRSTRLTPSFVSHNGFADFNGRVVHPKHASSMKASILSLDPSDTALESTVVPVAKHYPIVQKESSPSDTRLLLLSCRKSSRPKGAPGSASLSLSSKKQEHVSDQNSDRFIPSRYHLDICRRNLLNPFNPHPAKESKPATDEQDPFIQRNFERHMKSTVCEIPLRNLDRYGNMKCLFSYSAQKKNANESKAPNYSIDPFAMDSLRATTATKNATNANIDFWDDELDYYGESSLKSRRRTRMIAHKPNNVFDAPGIIDNFYLNLCDWSKDNIIVVALNRQAYIYNVCTKAVDKVMDLDLLDCGHTEYVSSVQWCREAGCTHWLAVGTSVGWVHIVDTRALQSVLCITAMTSAVYSLAWKNGTNIVAGGCNGALIQIDTLLDRRQGVVAKFAGNTSNVCSLAWSEGGNHALASGSNDNHACIFDVRHSGTRPSAVGYFATVEPRLVLSHNAAVKALAWCPFHSGILATGGSTADRTIKIWSESGSILRSVDTGSQVTALQWNVHDRELISAHGFDHFNISIWDFPTLRKIQNLSHHRGRVLNVVLGPDGTRMASISADETLCLWTISNPALRASVNNSLPSFPGCPIIR
jgi:cell division cycle 20, cofactor of APC complex